MFEAEVFELGLDGEQAEAVGERSVDVEGLSGDFVAFVGSHAAEGAHVVEAVGHFDEDYADVLAHGEEKFTEVLGLDRCFVAEDAARDFGETVDNLCYLWAEVLLDVFDGVVGVFDDVVEQGSAYAC